MLGTKQLVIGPHEPEFREVRGLAGIQAVLPILELHNGIVTVPDCVVVSGHNALQTFDEAALQVPRRGSFDGCVDQPITTSDGVNVVVLRPDACKVAPLNPCLSGSALVGGCDTGQASTGYHIVDPEAPKGLLAQVDAHLSGVRLGPLGTGRGHQGQHVEGEGPQHPVGEQAVHLGRGLAQGRDALRLIVQAGDARVPFLQQLLTALLRLGLQTKVCNAASEGEGAQDLAHQSADGGQHHRRHLVAVEFEHRMDQTVRLGTHLLVVHGPDQHLAVTDDHPPLLQVRVRDVPLPLPVGRTGILRRP
mmetsp:Transcript_16474/g.29284  ORF Transcript_16474/g.29284 Transcript_16474/m.29284 type:complete len:305 (-) Transcript_16474:284-1198(-)